MGTPIDQLQAVRRIRDYAVALSLSPTPQQRSEAEHLIVNRQESERVVAERSHVTEKQSLAHKVERLEVEISSLEALTGGAEPDEKLSELLRVRDALVTEIAEVHAAVRRRRNEYEERLTSDELQRLDDEERELLHRASADRLSSHEARVAAWRDGAATRDLQRQRLIALDERLEKELSAANKRAEAIRDPLISRTVAGFLLWAGYSAVAATGAAVAYLLGSRSPENSITTLARAIVGIAGATTSAMPSWLLLPANILIVIAVLLSVAASFVGCDRLIQYFDKNWRRQRRGETGFSRAALGLPSPEIGRRAYVQALALLPFAYIVGLTVIFLTYRAGTPQSAAAIIGLAPTILHTVIGSVITLLAAAVFVLYSIKVIEKRAASDEERSIRDSWEIVLLPLLLTIAFTIAMWRPAPDRYVWGGIALFMVVSSIGLAYGVVYRGVFRDVDEVIRLLRACESDLESLDCEPELEKSDRAEKNEIRQVRQTCRRRRQTIRDDARRRRFRRRDLRTDETPERKSSGSLLTRWFGSAAASQSQAPRDWRLIDEEAAPDEAKLRAELQEQLTKIEPQIADLSMRSAASDVRARLKDARNEYATAKYDLDTADDRALEESARLRERQAIEIEEFRRAYEVGLMVKPAFEVIRGRTEDVAKAAAKYWHNPEAEL